ncbi:MAG: hypothetical protein JXQ65_00025 [Candidatus Marinimicrobia bacterium]|nr:hypothetical protein [Candidatus Neomarinimicrobiota bacterium]
MKITQRLDLCLLMLFLVILTECKNWEKQVEKNGIYFDKIHQSKGGTRVGYMNKNQTIDGLPCEKGWIHFRKNWDLLSIQLSSDFEYKGLLLPKNSWLHLSYDTNSTDYVVSFPYDIEVQGFWVDGTGSYKGTHTGFYGSGKIRSFYPAKELVIQGIPCKRSLLENILVYENGRLQRCKLSKDFKIDGKRYPKGTTVYFDEEGRIK